MLFTHVLVSGFLFVGHDGRGPAPHGHKSGQNSSFVVLDKKLTRDAKTAAFCARSIVHRPLM